MNSQKRIKWSRILKQIVEEALNATSGSDLKITHSITLDQLNVTGPQRQKVNDWFDVFNISIPVSDSRARNRAYGLALEEQNRILNKCLRYTAVQFCSTNANGGSKSSFWRSIPGKTRGAYSDYSNVELDDTPDIPLSGTLIKKLNITSEVSADCNNEKSVLLQELNELEYDGLENLAGFVCHKLRDPTLQNSSSQGYSWIDHLSEGVTSCARPLKTERRSIRPWAHPDEYNRDLEDRYEGDGRKEVWDDDDYLKWPGKVSLWGQVHQSAFAALLPWSGCTIYQETSERAAL
ncbi:hypothetical protein NQ318_020384 [Aromia moschata]|uniref:Uncharacterized protein n=1 Tax=Aromia moschata TaxID=1265417 RepID=A0AAV8Y3R8_9CUCU|nr:hypothetical protein NQ318_020384 [Aromia moschata]